MAATLPLPRLDAVNRPFWTGGADGALRFMRCGQCATFIHPPRPICRVCLSDDVAPDTVPGTGIVHSFTINHQPWLPGMEVPFVIARVAIDGAPGVLLTTNVVGCPVDAVAVGDAVRVTFDPRGEGDGAVWVPQFEKVS